MDYHNGNFLQCCDKCSSIVIPSREENKDTTNTCLTIFFMSKQMYHVVHLMSDVHTNNAQHIRFLTQ